MPAATLVDFGNYASYRTWGREPTLAFVEQRRQARMDCLLDRGELPFFEVCGERRVFMDSVMTMLAEHVNAAQAGGVLGNPVNQAHAIAGAIADDKALIEELSNLETSPGTFGELLRTAAMSVMADGDAGDGRVVALRPIHTQQGN